MTKERYAEHLAYMRRYRARRLAQGLCMNCGEPNDRHPMVRCRECARVDMVKRDEAPLTLCACKRRRVYRSTGRRQCWQCRRKPSLCE